jgi:hypothetical protein
MKKYSISYSKTNEDTILEDNHFIYGIIPKWNSLETKKYIVDLLNEKEKEIDELKKENRVLKEYSEELETHIPKETLKLIKKVLLK